ncbi:MAG: MBL fold metallo-hydrolase [Flavobacteriaceae bacterium]|nr:MBL fold metallo-hydrolase [Flavobacteriaceae bacterium]
MKTKFYSILLLSVLLYTCKTENNKTVTPVIEDTPASIEEHSTTDTHIEKEPEVISSPKINNFIEKEGITISPIEHGTMVLEYNGTNIYVDPVGGKDAFNKHKAPDFIIITDIHGDHLDVKTLETITTPNTVIIGPKAVKEKLPEVLQKNYNVIFNGLSRSFSISKMDVDIEAIAMYNLREEALKFHPKERGNGYVLTLNNIRIYISGDTEDIFEMRQLKDIDIAFVCMNLPYTMTVESAASAVLQFAPKQVYPYHYRGTEGYSDVNRFKEIVNNGNKNISVGLLNWYPEQ